MPVPKKKRTTSENTLSTSEVASPSLIGAAWGECNPKRKGYRNGAYTHDLSTATGQLEEIHVPRDRNGQFHTQAFERYSRFEPHIARSD
jgi:putative transposase